MMDYDNMDGRINMDVIILDAHPEEDARIKRHVKYLIDQGSHLPQ